MCSEAAEGTAQGVAVADSAASRARLPRRPSPAIGQICQGHPYAALLIGCLDAGPVQHRPPVGSRDVHLRDLWHVVLHARQEDEGHRRRVQL